MTLLNNRIVLQTWRDNNVTDLIESYGAITTDDPDDDYDLAVFTGGADICPFLYGEKPNKRTSVLYHRDLHELNALHRIPFGTPVIGICRGAQLLNVHAGGSLYQDVDNHFGEHDACVMKTGQLVRINSIHHQMMIPTTHAITLLSAKESTRRERGNQIHYIKDEMRKTWPDPECLWIPHHNYLCFQAHPELSHAKGGTRTVFDSFVADHVVPLLK